METEVLEASPRTEFGTRASIRQRKEGKIPAIIYGHKQENVAVLIDGEQLALVLRHGGRMLDIKLSDKTETAIIKEVQYDHLGDTVLNVDFTRVSLTEKVTVEVEVVLHGIPEGTHEGGHLDQPVHQVSVECLPKNIPEKIDANVAHLKLGEALAVGDLQMPEGVECVTNPETKLAIVHLLRGLEQAEEEVEGEAIEGKASGEPEVLRQKTPEEEEGSGKK